MWHLFDAGGYADTTDHGRYESDGQIIHSIWGAVDCHNARAALATPASFLGAL